MRCKHHLTARKRKVLFSEEIAEKNYQNSLSKMFLASKNKYNHACIKNFRQQFFQSELSTNNFVTKYPKILK
jgi:hypothetical protein